jgi:DNA repair photolyase
VFISITTLDDEPCGAMEPRTSRPAPRLEARQRIASAGVPCGVMVAPVVPGLTDHEMPAILQAAATAGATRAAYTTLRLPGAVADIFETWLPRSPARRGKVMARIRSLRGGHRNDSRFGVRMQGEGAFAKQISAIFSTACRRVRLNRTRQSLSATSFRRSGQQRLPL